VERISSPLFEPSVDDSAYFATLRGRLLAGKLLVASLVGTRTRRPSFVR
jgi:hypothetical protein